MEAVSALEGQPVAVDVTINRPAPAPWGSGPEPVRENNVHVGVLERREVQVSGDTPADEAVWWYRREGKTVIGVAGESESGFLLQRDQFEVGHWEADTLILHSASIS